MERAGISPKHVNKGKVTISSKQGKRAFGSEKDLKERLKFAKNIRKDCSKDVWKDNVAFYLDRVSFWYKRNPADQVSAPYCRIWRKKCKGLMRGCTSKGGKVRSGGKVVKVIVAISYGKGVIVCHQYDKLDGAHFAKFVQDNFDNMFRLANKIGSRLFVQDNCSVQNSSLARRVLRDKRGKQLKLPREVSFRRREMHSVTF